MKSDFQIDSEDLDEEEQQRLCLALGGLAEGDAPLAFELVFMGEEEIKELNVRERGVEAVTDVLSFPTMDDIKGKPILSSGHRDCIDEEGRILLGSIAICKKRAEEQAKEYGHSLEREIYYLTVHGVLHCLGFDHMTDEDKKEMRAKEEEVMIKMNLARD